MFSFAIHSHKGGVGKTTLAVNLAVKLASSGHRVCLLDMDLWGPNLYTFFQNRPKLFVNDYFNEKATISEVVKDFSAQYELNGTLYIGFADPSSDSVQYMINLDDRQAMNILTKSVSMLKRLQEEPYNIDYLILDTTPGLAFTSVNSFILTDLIIFIIKFSNADIEGTISMISGLIENLNNKATILANSIPTQQLENADLIDSLEKMITERIIDKTDLDRVSFLGWIPYDEELLNKEFLKMVSELQNKPTERIIHALLDDHPIVTALDKTVDNLLKLED